MGLYICVMVITYLYGYNRHGDREIWRWREAIHPDAYLSGWLFRLVRFTLVRLVQIFDLP